MKFTASQTVSQKQSIVITAQLQQAIKLLQMNNFELGQFLEEQSVDNPFLDVESATLHESASTKEYDTPVAASVTPTDIKVGEAAEDTPLNNEALENTFESSLLDLGNKTSSGMAHQDWDMIASTVEERKPSLYAYVCGEIDQLLSRAKRTDDRLCVSRSHRALRLVRATR